LLTGLVFVSVICIRSLTLFRRKWLAAERW
jgi:hypothetical protein